MAARQYHENSQQIMPLNEFAGGSGFTAIGLNELERAKQIFVDMLASTMTSNVKSKSVEAIVGFASLESRAGRFGRAFELLTFANSHPSCTYATKIRVRKLRDELSVELSADSMQQADARAKEMTLEETAASLLRT